MYNSETVLQRKINKKTTHTHEQNNKNRFENAYVRIAKQNKKRQVE